MGFPPFSSRPLVPQISCLAGAGHLQQFFGAGGSALRILAQTGEDELIDSARNLQLGAMRGRHRLLLHVLHQHLHRVGGAKHHDVQCQHHQHGRGFGEPRVI